MKKKRAITDVNEEITASEYGSRIISIIRGSFAPLVMKEKLENFHEKDIAEILSGLSVQERKKLYRVLDADMLAASVSGTLIPMLFKKIGVDPAVASGPLITTVNDLVAVLCYYGLSWIFLINIFRLGT